MPHYNSLIRWVKRDVDGFAARYMQARELGMREMLITSCGWKLPMAGGDPVHLPSGHTTHPAGAAAMHAHPGFAPKYPPEIADEICQRLARGEPLLAICRDDAMPTPGAVHKWVKKDTGGFAARYRQARELGLKKVLTGCCNWKLPAAPWAAGGTHV